MGAPAEWTKVLLYGIVFGPGLWLFTGLWPSERKRRQAWPSLARLLFFVSYVLLGLGFGLAWTFQSRIFHGGLLLIFVTVVAVSLAMGLAFRNLVPPEKRIE